MTVVGEEAHIRAQSVGGPRYDPHYAGVDGYANLMLLCPTHHSMIDADSGAGYSVAALLQMKSEHEKNQARREDLQSTLRAYLGDRYAAENTVQFQQAELHGPSVDAMFVDVPVGARRDGSSAAELLESIATTSPGDTEELEGLAGLVVTGATQALLHPDWKGHAILVGGPGQGKSTVLQYVCQFHRARRLGEDGYTAGDTGLARTTSVARFPIRVDLRKYAEWAGKSSGPAEKKGAKSRRPGRRTETWRSLEEYLTYDIDRHIGANKFTPKDLALLLATEPVLVALDGLDEVAKATTRHQVAEEISSMRGRLSANAADLMILIATRPGTSLLPLTSSRFPVLHLQRLTQGLRLQYLQRWIEASSLSSEAAARLRSTFTDSQHVPHISELASYPMQLAILLHLLYRRQLLPQQRTDLYREYVKTFLDREQTEDKEPLLADQRRVVEDTHAYLGWYLQSKAEQGNSAGSITRTELRSVLRTYLAGQPEEQLLADELYSAITDRVLCLVERDDAFEFEVQSLREYFAAVHMFENLTSRGKGNSKDDGLNELLERPYWGNVCRFFIGMLSRGEVRALSGNFRAADKKVRPHPLVRSMAVLVLGDRIYDGFTSGEIRDVVDFVFEGPGVILAQDGSLDASGNPLRLGDKAGREQAVVHLQMRLEKETDPAAREAAARRLIAHVVDADELASWWWEKYAPTISWLETASRLGILRSLTTDQSRQLKSLLREADEPDVWRADLLSTGGYDGHDDEIVEAVVTDLNNGAAETADPSRSVEDLRILISGAANLLGDGGASSLGGLAPCQAPERSVAAARICQAMQSAAAFPSSLRVSEWEQFIAGVAAAWGDGWVLRRVISRVPESIDLSLIAAGSRQSAWAVAIQREADYRSHRADAEWWRSRFASTGNDRELMLTIVALLEHARTSVVVAVASDLDRSLHSLNVKQFRVVERCLLRDAASHRVRALDMQEPLRLNLVQISGRCLWLMWIIGTDSTRQRIPSHLEAELSDVFGAGAADARAAINIGQVSRKLRLEGFRGARPSLPEGGWTGQARLAAMTASLAKSILKEPGQWPSDFVQLAADRLNAQAAARGVSLADVATRNGWFGL